MSFIDAGYEILKRTGKSLTAEEITTIALDQGLISTTGKTPSATMSAQLYMDIRRKADNSRFVKVDRGCLLYTSPSPRDRTRSRMPSSA